MPESFQDMSLVVRDNQRESQQRARRTMMAAAITGKPLDLGEMAKARGLVVRERDNSVFSDAWIPLAVLFLIIGLVAGRNPAMIALGVILLLIVGLSTVWKNLSLWGVGYDRQLDRNRVFPGEPIDVTVRVSNDKPLPLTWLRFRDEMPVPPDADDVLMAMAADMSGRYTLQNTYSMQSKETVERTSRLVFPRRGFYRLGPVTYESGDIFTLFTREREYQYLETIVVYPQIWPLDELGLPAKEPFGDIKVHQSLFTDPINTRGIRDYQSQDRFRDVHWKATARRGQLQTKVYDPSTGMTMAVFLNVATSAKHWMGFDPDLLERAVSVAASAANYAALEGWGVGLYANGAVPNSDQPIRVPAGRAPDQLGLVLEGLAAVSEFATASIDQMLLRESPHLPWVSTIVLVTANVTDEMMIALLRLREAGRRVVLISLADDPPAVTPQTAGILTYHIPANTPAFAAGHQSATATEAALSQIPTPDPVNLELESVASYRGALATSLPENGSES